MKKLLLIILFLCLFFCGKAQAAVYTAVAGGGNWSADATWGGGGHPVAGDTANIDATMTGTVTVDAASACAILNMTGNGGTLAFGTQTLTVSGLATLQGAMTSTSGTLSVAGGVTLAGTPTGSFPTLVATGTQTLTSGGFTWGGALNLTTSSTKTLVGNWVNTGLVTSVTTTQTINRTTNETLTCNGGLTITGTTAGTITLIIGGGTWSGAGSLACSLTFNCTTATISGTVIYRDATITYTAGTITTTSSTLQLNSTTTLNCVNGANSITWDNITVNTIGTITLASDLTCSGVLYFSSSTNTTLAGAYNISCGTLKISAPTQNKIIGLMAGQTLTATTGLQINGDPSGVLYVLIRSRTASTSTYLNYQGAVADCKVAFATFTDVDASGSAQGIDNWYGGTLTRTTNITNRTSADIGGGGTSSGASFFSMN